MSASDETDLESQLPIPETMKIAQLLAELMPTGPHATPASAEPAPAFGEFAPAAAPPPLSPEPPEVAEFFVVPGPVAPPPPELSPVLIAERPAAPPPARLSPSNTPDFPKPADPDLIPLGDLKQSAFFDLMNWSNDPDRARHPRRSEYGLDEATLQLARTIPFYVAGQPRLPDRCSVQAVLSEFVWE